MIPLAVCFVVAGLSSGRAQDQERKLVDRLLRPDTSLQNSEQNKKFVADGAPVDKRARVSTFYIQQKTGPKNFSGTRDFATEQFASQSFNHAHDGRTKSLSQKSVADSRRSYATSSATNLRGARDANKRTHTRDFSGKRPFLDRGKSQKSLNRQNPPLTIEQVRELLNKNK
jgi:hypothetical protein